MVEGTEVALTSDSRLASVLLLTKDNMPESSTFLSLQHYTGWFTKNVIHSGNWFVMSCWWKKFIWIWVRFSIVSEKTMYVFRNGMKPCEPHSVDLHSAWDKRAISWYWGMTFLTGNIMAWLVFRVSRLGDKSRIGLPESPPRDWFRLLAIYEVLGYY